ncbi:MAG: hypothetical protein HKN23_01235, partial [Verrucomicrobiales bacterium]|nr:hypothetical protein [Verrucomicrobiales bacterium]
MTRFLLAATCLTLFSSVLFAQHDIQRNAVQRIAKGQYDEAAKTLEGGRKPNAGEAETLFVEMLSLLHQDKTEAAMDKAWKSVEAGLPFSRLLAGPPEQLAKLHD